MFIILVKKSFSFFLLVPIYTEYGGIDYDTIKKSDNTSYKDKSK